MENQDFIFAETQEVVPVQPLPFTAVSVFQGALTPETITAALLEQYSAPEAYVICKRWAELFAGSGSGDSKKTGAADLLKERATKSLAGKKMEIAFDGVTVAEVSERRMPAQYLYADETLTQMEQRLEALKLDIKQRKEKLQKAKADVPDANGEIVTPAQLIECGSTIAVKFRK